MKVKVKSKSKLPTDLRCKGRITAEGKKAKPVFCWREKVLRTDAWGKKTGVEIYSRVSGKMIGYLGSQNVLVTDPSYARTADQLNASLIPMHLSMFFMSAQSKAKHYRHEREALKAIIKAAKASK